jgi:hypothetical protein
MIVFNLEKRHAESKNHHFNDHRRFVLGGVRQQFAL